MASYFKRELLCYPCSGIALSHWVALSHIEACVRSQLFLRPNPVHQCDGQSVHDMGRIREFIDSVLPSVIIFELPWVLILLGFDPLSRRFSTHFWCTLHSLSLSLILLLIFRPLLLDTVWCQKAFRAAICCGCSWSVAQSCYLGFGEYMHLQMEQSPLPNCRLETQTAHLPYN